MKISPRTWRRLLLLATLGALAGVFVIPLNPVGSKFLRLALLCALGAAWGGLLLLSWKQKTLRIALLALPVLAAIPFLLPGRVLDRDQLREDYLARMSDLEDTRYYWGGENSRGIDCSGLPRRGLRGALLSQGVRKLNGRALRLYAEQWWHDASALALSQGYREYTVPLQTTGTIAEMSYDQLQAGDLAVTTNGRHVIIYLGEGRWIQADPGLGKVATLHGRDDENGWFSVPVTTHRWKVLAGNLLPAF